MNINIIVHVTSEHHSSSTQYLSDTNFYADELVHVLILHLGHCLSMASSILGHPPRNGLKSSSRLISCSPLFTPPSYTPSSCYLRCVAKYRRQSSSNTSRSSAVDPDKQRLLSRESIIKLWRRIHASIICNSNPRIIAMASSECPSKDRFRQMHIPPQF